MKTKEINGGEKKNNLFNTLIFKNNYKCIILIICTQLVNLTLLS